MIVQEGHVRTEKHGLPPPSQSTMAIHRWNAPTKEFVTVTPENVNASRIMMAWHVNGHHVQTIARERAFVFHSHRSQILHQRPTALHGTPKSTLDVSVILDTGALTVHKRNALLEVM